MKTATSTLILAGLLTTTLLAHGEDSTDLSPLAVVPVSTQLPPLLTLDGALALFRTRSLDLRLAEATIASAEGDQAIASARPNPIVNGGVGHSYNYGNGSCVPAGGCGTTTYVAGISDNAALGDTLVGKRGLRRKVARAMVASAQLSKVDTQRTLEFQVKQAYAQVALADESLEFAKVIQESNIQTFDLTTKKYNAGAINEGDLARVETAKLEADQAVITASQSLRNTRIALALLLGMRAHISDFEVEEDFLAFRIPPLLEKATPDTLLAEALHRRPDLQMLGYERARADASIELARRQRIPDVALSLNYTQTGLGPNAIQAPTLVFGISTPLPLLYQQQGEVRKASADAYSQALSEAKIIAQIVSDVETAFASYTASKLLLENMERRLLERARTARDIVLRQFHGGTATLIDFLDAQRTYIATNLEYLQDLTNYWTAIYLLEQAVGMDLRK